MDASTAAQSVALGRVDADLLDAGKRASDAINLHRLVKPWDDIKHTWMAFRLSDGSSDGVLYDNRLDAVRHQVDERLCAYVAMKSLQMGASPKDMAIYLQFHRDAYNAGMRLTDPDQKDGGMDVLPTARRIDWLTNRARGL